MKIIAQEHKDMYISSKKMESWNRNSCGERKISVGNNIKKQKFRHCRMQGGGLTSWKFEVSA